VAWSFDVEECEAGAGYGTDSPGIQSDLIEASEPDFEVGVGLLRQGAQRADHLAGNTSVPIKFAEGSRQNPVPASCFVPIDPSKPADGRAYLSNTLLELYFDGGTERKLQIRKILKAHCIVHATWRVTAS
jgi:hypothetical protein